MKRPLIAVGMLLFSSLAFSSGGAAWDYTGDTGPDNWAKLSPEYSSCAGSNQSPINMTGFVKAKLKPIEFDYHNGGGFDILNNGHTIQINVNPGNTITVDGIKFELKQFHFHAPSENQIRGKSYPMEAHLVHADKDGNLAVIAVMIKKGRENSALEKAWAQIPKEGKTSVLRSFISPREILPENRDYYRFNGSLTTPPCSEGVRWLVMKRSITASKDQIKRFEKVMGHPNNRPVQPLNARKVMR